MKHPIRFPSGKERILLIAASVCLFTAGILAFLSAVIRGGQPSQQMAQRWDQEGGSAQISCFFSNGLEITPDTLRGFEYTLKSQLQEASVEAPSENARLWSSAYSARGQITLSSGLSSVDTVAYGVGGDYFPFHRQKQSKKLWQSALALSHPFPLLKNRKI